ncbi:MAG: LysM peptidoglycan-binding domain-containing protein [Ruminococcaceae bacterium]|nr:LysM peptidoglycan-binding domain-containing protein [Oscillospiraceae bacterium]
MLIHTVQSGENIYSIARTYNVPPSRIITDNQLSDPGRLVVGQTLVILFPTEVYTVRGGDTLTSVSARSGVPVLTLYRNNPQLKGKPEIFPGQVLNLAYETPPLGTIRTNGYAYAYIDRDVLRQTLPYLTYLSIFSYGLGQDGTLVLPSADDDDLIALAREYSTVPLMMLTSLTEEGTFSSELAATVLTTPELRDKIIQNTVETVIAKGYGGVDVDLEYIPADAAADFAAFIGLLREALPEGYVVFASLAPKYSADQRGLLYEGHDYAAVGAAADFVLLMTYEWGYTYGPPMAVSPIPNVRRVISYGLTEIPAEKMFIGYPNYGYDWPLPFVRGETKAQSLSNVAAVARAGQRNAAIEYDTTAEAPYYTYFDRPASYADAVEHEVWFQDARSADAMLRLVREYGLTGASVWNIMRYFPSLWLVVNSLYAIEKLI